MLRSDSCRTPSKSKCFHAYAGRTAHVVLSWAYIRDEPQAKANSVFSYCEVSILSECRVPNALKIAGGFTQRERAAFSSDRHPAAVCGR